MVPGELSILFPNVLYFLCFVWVWPDPLYPRGVWWWNQSVFSFSFLCCPRFFGMCPVYVFLQWPLVVSEVISSPWLQHKTHKHFWPSGMTSNANMSYIEHAFPQSQSYLKGMHWCLYTRYNISRALWTYFSTWLIIWCCCPTKCLNEILLCLFSEPEIVRLWHEITVTIWHIALKWDSVCKLCEYWFLCLHILMFICCCLCFTSQMGFYISRWIQILRALCSPLVFSCVLYFL